MYNVYSIYLLYFNLTDVMFILIATLSIVFMHNSVEWRRRRKVFRLNANRNDKDIDGIVQWYEKYFHLNGRVSTLKM